MAAAIRSASLLKRLYNFWFPIQWAPSEVYTTTLCIKTIYDQWCNLQPLPWGFGGFIILKNIISDLTTTLNKIAVSKSWLEGFGEIMGVGGALFVLQSLLTIKKGTDPFNLQLNELFLKFLRQQMVISKFITDPFGENMTWG